MVSSKQRGDARERVIARALNALPIDALGRYERELYAFVTARHPELWTEMQTKGNDSKSWDALQTRMKAALTAFAKEFSPEASAA